MKLFKLKCRHDWETHWYNFVEFKEHFPVAGYQYCRKCAGIRNLYPMCMPGDEVRGKI